MSRVRRVDALAARMCPGVGEGSHLACALITSHPFAEISRELPAIAAPAGHGDVWPSMKNLPLSLIAAASLDLRGESEARAQTRPGADLLAA